MTAESAPETDRLVWAVTVRVWTQHGAGELDLLPDWEPSEFGPLINLAPFLHRDVAESLVRRRYVYVSDTRLDAMVEHLCETGMVTRVDGRLHPTEALGSVREGIERACREASWWHWAEHIPMVERALSPARQVLEAWEPADVLTRAALELSEPEDEAERLFQRLTHLRLVRNEAHVRAWQAARLEPHEVEVLTGAWTGTNTVVRGGGSHAPPDPTTEMTKRGLVADGEVTAAGLGLRQQIEDDTNAAVAPAYSVIDQKAFVNALRALPGTP
ncbi:MAG: helix-turn-helix domain-containing protein [Acidimicrobiales bacterium]